MSFGKKDLQSIKAQYADDAATRRNATRRRVLKGAKLVFNSDRSVIDVIIRDLSETGARLRLPDLVTLVPDSGVELRRRTNGPGYPAQVMWVRAGEMGIRFLKEAIDIESFLSDAPSLLELANSVSPEPLLSQLRIAKFFNDPELVAASVQLSQAYDHIMARLRAREIQQ